MENQIITEPVESYLDRYEMSASDACTINERTPLHYWSLSKMNPARPAKEEADTEAVRSGKAFHVMSLEPETWDDTVAVLPYDDYRTKAAQEARDAAIAAGKTPLKRPTFERLQPMLAALMSHPIAAALLKKPGHVEKTLLWRDDATGAECRTRPDKIAADLSFFIDLKTATDASDSEFSKHAWQMGYAVQSRHQADGIAACYGKRPQTGYLIVIERDYPHAVAVKKFDGESVAKADLLLKRARMIWAACKEANYWPGYEGFGLLSCPAWVSRVIDDAEDAGAFKAGAAKVYLEQARAAQAPFGG